MENKSGLGPGEDAYDRLCASCHGGRREGSPPAFPSLIGVDKRLSYPEIAATIHQGKGRMPAFPMVGDTTLPALIRYLEQGADSAGQNAGDKQEMSAGSASNNSAAAAPATADPAGAASYAAHCAICHGDRREGITPSFPALVGIGSRMPRAQVLQFIHQGKGRMPAFPKLQGQELAALLRFIGVPEHIPAPQPAGPDAELKYGFTGYRKFLDQDGYPAITPPWGTLNAIDLNSGRYLWKIPLGEYPELAAHGMKDTGTENYGGPIVTAGGIVFIGATIFDRKMHAYDSHTGRLLWEATLPFAGHATPATYMIDGKQYVVIAAGGGRDPKWPSGGVYVAFALPPHKHAGQDRRPVRAR
jgi:mono/diheme cytochrome c family protein